MKSKEFKTSNDFHPPLQGLEWDQLSQLKFNFLHCEYSGCAEVIRIFMHFVVAYCVCFSAQPETFR